mmetsp:Transcript_9427/g.14440  ORF Transcript_9427/g.14440 Transcript_9427/m.14440 type:complete len:83 (+) Transcript_9427:3035-3283(+)
MLGLQTQALDSFGGLNRTQMTTTREDPSGPEKADPGELQEDMFFKEMTMLMKEEDHSIQMVGNRKMRKLLSKYQPRPKMTMK